MFEAQLGRNMEAYIDDMVIKSKVASDTYKTWRKLFLCLENTNYG